nr:reverse transcriptase domain-containing protein [Tanacetum cinerariifolium]
MLKVSPWKGVICFEKQGKLNQRYIRPFKVLAKVGPVAYRLELPQQLSKVLNTFHVSNLEKFLSDETLIIPLEEFQVDNKLHFFKEPVEIMDLEDRALLTRKDCEKSAIFRVVVHWCGSCGGGLGGSGGWRGGGARLEMEGVVAAAVVVLLEAGEARGGEWGGGSYRSGWEERFWGSPEKLAGKVFWRRWWWPEVASWWPAAGGEVAGKWSTRMYRDLSLRTSGPK